MLYFTIFSFGEIPPTVLGRPLLIKVRSAADAGIESEKLMHSDYSTASSDFTFRLPSELSLSCE